MMLKFARAVVVGVGVFFALGVVLPVAEVHAAEKAKKKGKKTEEKKAEEKPAEEKKAEEAPAEEKKPEAAPEQK